VELRRLATEFLDFLRCRVRFEQCMVDKTGHFACPAAGSIKTESACTCCQHAAHLVRAAVRRKPVTCAASGSDGTRRRQLLENNFDNAAYIRQVA
jgi:hypothetical protein